MRIPVRQYVWAMCRDAYESCEHESFHPSREAAESAAETAFLAQCDLYEGTKIDASIRNWHEDLSHHRTWGMEHGTNFRLWSAKCDKNSLKKMYSTDFYIERIGLHGKS